MPVTIKDVARRAGVAISTVSRVINNSGYVAGETRERVLRAVDDLKFVPSHMARSLVSRETKSIGLIMPDITNPFFPAIARGVEDAAKALGYTVVLCNTDDDLATEESYVKTLREKFIDGIVFVNVTSGNQEINSLLRDGMPVIALDRSQEVLEASAVLVDNVEGGYLATRYLLDRGHRLIAHISGPDYMSTSLDRRVGYRKALTEAGLEVAPGFLRRGDFRLEGGYREMKGLLSEGLRPTAVFAANDLMAIGAMQALEEVGLEVPTDVSVVGFDDITLASLVKPSLTTIRQPAYQMGQEAARLLVRRILRDEPRTEIILRGELVERNSVAPLPR
ncbi:MAG: LacI family transcriptional regulator [Firmicutes bacterium]|nr:LacI family transcriptional regulator [Bacillota bacterium]MCL5039720.1 LacI family transcriptional regulator [Bacillota bacterium]